MVPFTGLSVNPIVDRVTYESKNINDLLDGFNFKKTKVQKVDVPKVDEENKKEETKIDGENIKKETKID